MTSRKGHPCLRALAASILMISSVTLAQAASTGWSLDAAQSALDIQITDHRPAGNTLTHMRAAPIAGTITANGDIDIPLSLNQLDVIAQLPTMLTQKALNHGTQHIQGHIDPSALNALRTQQSITTTVSFWDPTRHPDSRQRVTTPVQLTRQENGLIRVATPTPVNVDISPLLQQDNASLVTNLLGYQQIDRHALVVFQGTLRPQS